MNNLYVNLLLGTYVHTYIYIYIEMPDNVIYNMDKLRVKLHWQINCLKANHVPALMQTSKGFEAQQHELIRVPKFSIFTSAISTIYWVRFSANLKAQPIASGLRYSFFLPTP